MAEGREVINMSIEELILDTLSLKPNPLNVEIYGNEPIDTDLLDDIKKNDQHVLIVIDENNMIISGHRRWVVMKELGVPARCERKTYQSDIEKTQAFLSFNKQREKTYTQRLKEAAKIEDNIKAQSHLRKISNLKHSIDTPTLAERESGETRDIISQSIGMKRGSYAKVKAVFDKAESGNENAKAIMEKLDKKEISPNESANLLKLSDIAQSGDETAKKLFPGALEGGISCKFAFREIEENKFLAFNNPSGLMLYHDEDCELVKISTLKEHPMHHELFGDEPDLIDMIKEDIANYGELRHAPVVTGDNVIIDGHIRICALEKLGANYVYVRRKHYETETDEVIKMINISLVDNNHYNPLTMAYMINTMDKLGMINEKHTASLKYMNKFAH